MAFYCMPTRNLHKGRELITAFLGCVPASRSKSATAGNVNWTGHISLEQYSLAFFFGVGVWNRGKKGVSVGMLRVVEDLIAIRDLYDTPQIHNSDAVAHVFD